MTDVQLLVKQAIDDLDNDSTNLAIVINKCLRIAYALDDPKAVYAFKLESSGYENKTYNNQIKSEFTKSVLRKYDDYDLAKRWQFEIAEDYIVRRSVRMLNSDNSINQEPMVKGLSIAEIESEISNMRLTLTRNTVPEGLASLDLYYAQNSKSKLDSLLIFQLREAESLIAKVKNYVYLYLVEIEGLGSQGGAHMGLEKGINKKVFIIHGHDEARRRELEDILQNDFNLEPIVLEDQPSRGSSTIIDKFEFYASDCSYAIALFTPDDVIEKDGQRYFQARPNVLYEIGWFSSYLSRQRVLMLLQDGKDMEMFSDFDGVIQQRFKYKVTELFKPIQQELKYVGMVE